MVLINGVDGIACGFRSKISPRNPKEILLCMKTVFRNLDKEKQNIDNNV